MIYIYGLYEIGKDEIRYVGKTNNIEKRLYEHIMDSKRNNNTHKQIWIRNILNNGGNIGIELIETCSLDIWEERERYWISYYNNLTNHTEGGEGGSGKKYNITYEEAKIIVKKLNIKSKNEWFKYIKINNIEKIPSEPRNYFKQTNEWISWGDFLGTNRKQDNLIALNYISYEDAKIWIKNNINPKTYEDWKLLVKTNKIPKSIPNRPERYYSKRGWVSWGDFLGTNRVSNSEKNKIYISYEDAKDIVREIGIKSTNDWNNRFNSEIMKYNIPSYPSKIYKEWVSWGDFLGTNRKQGNLIALNYISYEDAKEYVSISLKIKTPNEWKENVNNNLIPTFIPNTPEQYYNKFNRGWKGWGDFLGTGKLINSRMNEIYLSYEDAKEYVKNNLSVKSYKEWKENIKKGLIPLNIPNAPDQFYKKQNTWINWYDFLNKTKKNDIKRKRFLCL